MGTNVSSPADKDRVINCAKQIQLTNMQASGSELHCSDEHEYSNTRIFK